MLFIKNLKNVQKKHKNLISFLKGVVKLQQIIMFNFEKYKKIRKNIEVLNKKTEKSIKSSNLNQIEESSENIYETNSIDKEIN